MTVGNFKEVFGTTGNDEITGSDLEIIYGLEGSDILTSSSSSSQGFQNANINILAGGFETDRYVTADNSLTIIQENGNSSEDVLEAKGISRDSLLIAEVEESHLFVIDLSSSNQYVLLVDWQEDENRIERFELSNDVVLTYDEIAEVVNNLRQSNTLFEFDFQQLYDLAQTQDIDIERTGLTPENIDGALEQVFESAIESDSTVVYRFFNTQSGVHFYTASEAEKDFVNDNLFNYTFEGASYLAADPLTGNPESIPVYRFFNQNTGVHLYTISEAERDFVQNNLSNYNFEGEVFNAHTSQVENSIPIYRFYNNILDSHFYTPSVAERNFVENELPDYQFEGVAYYAFPLEDV